MLGLTKLGHPVARQEKPEVKVSEMIFWFHTLNQNHNRIWEILVTIEQVLLLYNGISLLLFIVFVVLLYCKQAISANIKGVFAKKLAIT